MSTTTSRAKQSCSNAAQPADGNAVRIGDGQGQESKTPLAQSAPNLRPLNLIKIDLTERKAQRLIKKQSFLIKPWEYLGASRDSKLDPVIQAAFQVARPLIERVRRVRLHILEALHQGRTSVWKHCFQNLKRLLIEVSHHSPDDSVARIEHRYVQWTIGEVVGAISTLRCTIGFEPECLAFCTTYKKEKFLNQWSGNDRKNLWRSMNAH